MTDRIATARLDPDGMVVITFNWSPYVQRFPVADLPQWLRLYREFWSGAGPRDTPARLAIPGPCARFYAPTLHALEALQKQIVMP
jgi:hypothetical protein